MWGIIDLLWRTKYSRMHLVNLPFLLTDQCVMSFRPPVAHHDLPYILHRVSPFSAFPANQRLSRHSLTSTFATPLVCTKMYHSPSQQSDSVQNVTCYWSPIQENTVYLLYVYKDTRELANCQLQMWMDKLYLACTGLLSTCALCFSSYMVVLLQDC